MSFDLAGIRLPKQKPSPPVINHPQMVVSPFAIVIDSREQLPYTFSGIHGHEPNEIVAVQTVVRGLESGDYSIDGFEDRIAIERKSLEDLYGSVTWGRKRFEAEIGRLNDLGGQVGFAAVAIEADWREIANPAEHVIGWTNETNPASVVGTIDAWSVRYPRVAWLACGSRRGSELRAFGLLSSAWKEWNK